MNQRPEIVAEGPALIEHRALLVFMRRPEAGEVKRRLAEGVGEKAAAVLYAAFLEATVSLALRARPLLTPVGVGTPDRALPALRRITGGRLPMWPQGEGDLGERMARAVLRAFRGGAARVVVIGTDAPDIPLKFLLTATRTLDRHDLVLGPSTDGGYYLIGLNAPVPALFEDIPWSTPRVFEQTLRRASDLGLRTFRLPVWSDVDSASDLPLLAQRLRSGGPLPERDDLLAALEPHLSS